MAGLAQTNRDSVDAITKRLPLVLGLIAVITFSLLFMLTGSLVLPLKALLRNVLSLTAAFGAMVWIFQDGHLGALGTTPTGTAEREHAGAVVLHRIWAVDGLRGFPGLQDPRVLAGIRADPCRQRRERSARLGPYRPGGHRGGLGDVDIVCGAVRSPRVVHADAGLGLTLAVLIDATLVRMVLVPAFMHVLGRWNWWAPKPLVWLHDRLGLHEGVRESTERTAGACPAFLHGSGLDHAEWRSGLYHPRHPESGLAEQISKLSTGSLSRT